LFSLRYAERERERELPDHGHLERGFDR
jgi:hypothetical protein